MNSVTPMPRQCVRTCPSAAKSIRTSIGMIISQISMATGRLTWTTSAVLMVSNTFGKNCPRLIPTTMHRATHSVR